MQVFLTNWSSEIRAERRIRKGQMLTAENEKWERKGQEPTSSCMSTEKALCSRAESMLCMQQVPVSVPGFRLLLDGTKGAEELEPQVSFCFFPLPVVANNIDGGGPML